MQNELDRYAATVNSEEGKTDIVKEALKQKTPASRLAVYHNFNLGGNRRVQYGTLRMLDDAFQMKDWSYLNQMYAFGNALASLVAESFIQELHQRRENMAAGKLHEFPWWCQ